MPAVASVRKSQNEVTNNLTDVLNNINLDQRKTAYQIRDNQVAQDIAREQQAAQERCQRAAAAASSGWMSGLMGGGADPGVVVRHLHRLTRMRKLTGMARQMLSVRS